MHKAFLMKKPFLLFLLLLSMARGVAQDDSVSKAQEIIRLEQQLADALPGDSEK